MSASDRLALIGDIGGAHARFAICDIDELSVAHFVVFQTGMFPSLQDAIRHYLDSIPIRPETAGFAIAGDVSGERITMTRAPWSFTADEIASSCGVSRIHFVNGFEALASALPYLNAHDLATLREGSADPEGNKLVLGPGSGFGCAALVNRSTGAVPVYGHAGQMGFAATNARETAIFQEIASTTGYAALHDVLSGKGLETVYRVLAKDAGSSRKEISATDIVRRAEDGEDDIAEETLDCFAAILARAASDMALAFNARGGVYIAGGVTPKILRTLKKPAFEKHFLNKGEKTGFLESVPLAAVLAHDASLRGAALALSEKYPMQ